MSIEKQPVYFLKFGREKDLNALSKGDIYTNNGQFFRNLELEEKSIIKNCIGDKHENGMVYNLETLKLTSKDSHTPCIPLNVLKKIKCTFTYNEDPKYAMFCLYSLYEDDFEVVNDGYKLVLNEEKKDYILNNFLDGDRDSVLIIPAKLIISAILRECNDKEIECIHGIVNYYESGKPYKKQVMNFVNEDLERVLWKEQCYYNENEYRFFFNKKIDHGQVLINIGNVLSHLKPIKIDDFINKYDLIVS